MTKNVKEEYASIEDIRNDLDSLKTNVIELTRHIQESSIGHVHEVTDEMTAQAYKKAEALRKTGKRELKKIESQVKSHPGQSVALAFAAGMAMSMIMGAHR